MNNITLRNVIIPSGIDEIPAGAYQGCEDLMEVMIPDTVTKIGSAAFDSCSNLKSIILPESLASIGYGAFRNCSSLTEVIVSPEFMFPVERHIFDGCSSLDTSGLNIRSYDIDVLSEFRELEEALNTYAGAYLNGIDSQFLFVLEEIGTPNSEDVCGETELTDVNILWPVQQKDDGSIWVHRLGDIDFKTYIHNYLKDLLSDTFINVNAKICTVSETGMQKYGTLMKSFSTIDMRLIEVGGKWYILLADWSD